MSALSLSGGRRARGSVTLPGSKSLSNRLLLLAALSPEPTVLHNLLESDDVRVLRKALLKLGVELQGEGTTWQVSGGPLHGRSHAHLFLGNAGTAVRPLTALLAATAGEAVITGEPRMYERPIGPLVDALRRWGAAVEYLGSPGYPPLRLRGEHLAGGPTRVDASLSSQFVSALLLAAPLLRRGATIEVEGDLVSQPYIAMTIRQMQRFGVVAEQLHERLYKVAPQTYHSPGTCYVEGDATAASYFLAAGAIGGGPVRVHGAGSESVQGEIRFARVLQQMGAEVSWGPDWVEVSGGRLEGISCDLNDIPDSAMTLAVVALFAAGPSEIRGVGNWKVKECDRQDALARELTRLGARVEMLEDGLRIQPLPPEQWQRATIQTYGDHRMAMCFSLASLGPVGVEIEHPEVVSKTYPDYFPAWEALTS